MIDRQFALVGSVLVVHVIPLVDVAAVVLGPAATAAKTPLPYVTDFHCALGRDAAKPAVLIVAKLCPCRVNSRLKQAQQVIDRPL